MIVVLAALVFLACAFSGRIATALVLGGVPVVITIALAAVSEGPAPQNPALVALLFGGAGFTGLGMGRFVRWLVALNRDGG
ncbi:MAG TPA: hypothetical protein VEA80_08750 [Vitreimonas sp.]|uniref:hypothetical protein n=1 Tax=Vitreimonas sp. TaxID=3069702 RepID=UPI002D2792AA|nr:hypothetical protein [Vitreimonas sp.]HYD87548.1 hypothetical protein [Vitreimonas sp.]